MQRRSDEVYVDGMQQGIFVVSRNAVGMQHAVQLTYQSVFTKPKEREIDRRIKASKQTPGANVSLRSVLEPCQLFDWIARFRRWDFVSAKIELLLSNRFYGN